MGGSGLAANWTRLDRRLSRRVVRPAHDIDVQQDGPSAHRPRPRSHKRLRLPRERYTRWSRKATCQPIIMITNGWCTNRNMCQVSSAICYCAVGALANGLAGQEELYKHHPYPIIKTFSDRIITIIIDREVNVEVLELNILHHKKRGINISSDPPTFNAIHRSKNPVLRSLEQLQTSKWLFHAWNYDYALSSF